MLLDGQASPVSPASQPGLCGPRPTSSRRIPEFRKRKCLPKCTGAVAAVQAQTYRKSLAECRGSKLGKGGLGEPRPLRETPACPIVPALREMGSSGRGAGMTQGSQKNE